MLRLHKCVLVYALHRVLQLCQSKEALHIPNAKSEALNF